MKIQVYTWFFTVVVFLANSTSADDVQRMANRLMATGNSNLPRYSNYADEEYAHVFIYYPTVRSGSGFSVFLNRKNIGKLPNGGRIECRLLLKGPVAITLIEGIAYHEPLTQSKNSRTISVAIGKSYYFRVNGTGGLEYLLSPEKGEKNFTDDKAFIAQPTGFTETASDAIPSLKADSN